MRPSRCFAVRVLLLPLFLIAGCTSSLALAPAAKADFEDAEVPRVDITNSSFDAWCGKRKNNCKVHFEAEGVRVNNSKPVSYDRIIDFEFDENHGWGCHHENNIGCSGRAYTFDIFYTKSTGADGMAKFIFAHHPTAMNFLRVLKKSKGLVSSNSDPRCTQRGDVYKNGQCMNRGQAKEIEKREFQQSMDALADFAEDQQNRLDRQRELDIMELDAVTPDAVIDIQQNQRIGY